MALYQPPCGTRDRPLGSSLGSAARNPVSQEEVSRQLVGWKVIVGRCARNSTRGLQSVVIWQGTGSGRKSWGGLMGSSRPVPGGWVRRGFTAHEDPNTALSSQ